MKNFFAKFRKIAGFPFTFLLIMLVFLGVALGTSGSVNSTGKSLELQHITDTNWSWVVFKVSAPKIKDEKGEEKNMNVRLHDVYLNIGTIYSKEETATLELQWGSSSSTLAENFYKLGKMKSAKIYNQSYEAPADAEENKEEDKSDYIYGAAYSWIAPFGVTDLEDTSTYKSLTSPVYFKLVLPKVDAKYQKSNVLVNEIVFVGEVQGEDGGTGELVVLPVEIDPRTKIPAADGNEKKTAQMAGALIDAQRMPSFSQSSFFRYSEEEQKLLMTVAEMRMGNRYVPNDAYDGDRTYNSLGLSLTCLGTLIFGMSPFGIRFFNVLASFGILVVGYFFTRRLFRSDKAALSFAAIYGLCGVSVSLAHIASPIMIGVFFLLSSFAACYRYYSVGMKQSAPSQTVPLLIAGISGAFAVLVNGAFIVPVAGVAALFAAGLIKERRKARVALDEAIAFAEEEKAAGIPAVAEDGTESEGNRRVRTSLASYRYGTAAASSVFACSLILGIFVFSILFTLPVLYAADKIYNGVVGTSSNLFVIAFRLFSAGFKGPDPSGWNCFYPIFAGSGEYYAITLGAINFAAVLLAIAGIAFAIYRFVVLFKRNAEFGEYMPALVPLTCMLLCFVTAAFAGGSVAFVLAGYLFGFILIAGQGELFAQEGEKQANAVYIVKIVSLVSLAVLFALFAVFTFSIPLPAAFIGKFAWILH